MNDGRRECNGRGTVGSEVVCQGGRTFGAAVEAVATRPVLGRGFLVRDRQRAGIWAEGAVKLVPVMQVV